MDKYECFSWCLLILLLSVLPGLVSCPHYICHIESGMLGLSSEYAAAHYAVFGCAFEIHRKR